MTVINHSRLSKVVSVSKGRRGSSTDISTVVPKDSWRGRLCFILGGGPSLNGFDFNQLTGE